MLSSLHELVVVLENNQIARLVLGSYDENIAYLEKKLQIVAQVNGNHIHLKGASSQVLRAARTLEGLKKRASEMSLIRPQDVEAALNEADPSRGEVAGEVVDFPSLRTRRRGVIRARNNAQEGYLRLLKRHDLVFAEGPAGTGKTWLAVGHAVERLEQGHVERLILSRPAVEAGEKIGFLPGDMREKVDPYLRPVYDALYDFMEAHQVERLLTSGAIEIAPLAFMRGRTLSNALILLDEAQNATAMQMKMFLTRLGENSSMIVTGDPTQMDLPPTQKSGFTEAVTLLKGVEGVGHIRFEAEHVVRHDLVQRIVAAYEKKDV